MQEKTSTHQPNSRDGDRYDVDDAVDMVAFLGARRVTSC
jgi:hypothetical protein